MVSGRTQLLGLIGRPVERSLSFAMHNAALEALGLDWLYLPLPVRPGALETAFAGLAGTGFRGWNVTVPHKEEAARVVDALHGEAAELQAVNTVRVIANGLEGHNTDVAGLRRCLEGAALKGRRALVLGAGGAAAAAVRACQQLGLAVELANRTPERAERLAAHLGAVPLSWEEAAAAEVDLLVNATASGDPLPGLAPGPETLLLDLHYRATPLLARASRATDGLEMLVQQGAESLRLWTGMEPPVEVMRRAALEERARTAESGRARTEPVGEAAR